MNQESSEHRCGVQGFNGMKGDICPGCDSMRVKNLKERVDKALAALDELNKEELMELFDRILNEEQEVNHDSIQTDDTEEGRDTGSTVHQPATKDTDASVGTGGTP